MITKKMSLLTISFLLSHSLFAAEYREVEVNQQPRVCPKAPKKNVVAVARRGDIDPLYVRDMQQRVHNNLLEVHYRRQEQMIVNGVNQLNLGNNNNQNK